MSVEVRSSEGPLLRSASGFWMGERLGWAICLCGLQPKTTLKTWVMIQAVKPAITASIKLASRAFDSSCHNCRQNTSFLRLNRFSLVSEEMGTVAAKGHDAGRLVGLCLHLLSSSYCGDLPRLALGLLAALSSQVSLYRPRIRRGSLCNRRGRPP